MNRAAITLMFLYLFSISARAEVITYDIKKMGAKIGQATLTDAGSVDFEGKKLVLITFKTKGWNFYDEEKIYLAPDTLRPVVVLRDFDLNMFGKGKIEERYLPDEGKIKVIKESDGKTTEQILEKSGGIENIYGFIARYRKQGSFKIGDVLELRLPTKDIKIKLIKNLRVFAAEKYFDGFYMESNPAGYKIWFDAGPKKLPLRIVGSTGMASTLMIMKEHKE